MTTNNIRPLFPPEAAQNYPLRCPPIPKRSSWVSKRFWYYVHEYILMPFSLYYAGVTGDRCDGHCTLPLPFGLVLKRHGEITEEEVINMNVARAMGIPAPRAYSFGTLEEPIGKGKAIPSIVMTRISGVTLGSLDVSQLNTNVFLDDLAKIFARMRSFGSPFGDAVCGIDGGPILGTLIPLSPLPATPNEAAFQQQFRTMAQWKFTSDDEDHRTCAAVTEEFFSLPTHAIVFTHGDLIQHNIMVDPKSGHITGIIDWESAAWMPDYWEFSIVGIRRGSDSDMLMNGRLSGGAYGKEVNGHRHLYGLVGDLLPL
ncbi:hypothetical protein NLI96_g10933 [Meripilus lineatus]|uniref:Aminoglycoside phosphotransferase domain-containing protein n=1 Tax=Meripilus lineatus TaxID=2056292 RepID=A0AAD5UUB2_9APHY|nr:hypothetical protein NLI96_g10933 [Physisporinus lineatus]